MKILTTCTKLYLLPIEVSTINALKYHDSAEVKSKDGQKLEYLYSGVSVRTQIWQFVVVRYEKTSVYVPINTLECPVNSCNVFEV